MNIELERAVISGEKWKTEVEHDCDGAYNYKILRGDITYTCCGFVDKNAHIFMSDGDGDTCPGCGTKIEFSHQAKPVTIVRVCTIEPSASFVTFVNGSATLEQLQHAEQDLRDNFESQNIPPDVWEIEASLLFQDSYAYFGEIRHLPRVRVENCKCDVYGCDKPAAVRYCKDCAEK